VYYAYVMTKTNRTYADKQAENASNKAWQDYNKVAKVVGQNNADNYFTSLLDSYKPSDVSVERGPLLNHKVGLAALENSVTVAIQSIDEPAIPIHVHVNMPTHSEVA